MGRREAFTLIYKTSTISSKETVENIKAILTY